MTGSRGSQAGPGGKTGIVSLLRAPLHKQSSREAPFDKAEHKPLSSTNFRVCEKEECSWICFLHSGNFLCLLPHPHENAITFLLIWNPAPWKGNCASNSLPRSGSPAQHSHRGQKAFPIREVWDQAWEGGTAEPELQPQVHLGFSFSLQAWPIPAFPSPYFKPSEYSLCLPIVSVFQMIAGL